MFDNRRRLVIKALSCLPFAPISYVKAADRKICVVLDDVGAHRNNPKHIRKLKGIPITYAVIPHSGREKASLKELADYDTAQIILHQPMEASERKGGYKPRSTEKGFEFIGIYNNTPVTQVEEIIMNNVNHVNKILKKHSKHRIKGLNNHTGSLVTTNASLCEAIASACSNNGLYLLDSRTPNPASDSKLYNAGANMNIPSYRRDHFLDKVQGSNASRTLEDSLYEKVSRENNGRIISIGHMEIKSTIEAIKRFSEQHKGYLTTIA